MHTIERENISFFIPYAYSKLIIFCPGVLNITKHQIHHSKLYQITNKSFNHWCIMHRSIINRIFHWYKLFQQYFLYRSVLLSWMFAYYTQSIIYNFETVMCSTFQSLRKHIIPWRQFIQNWFSLWKNKVSFPVFSSEKKINFFGITIHQLKYWAFVPYRFFQFSLTIWTSKMK